MLKYIALALLLAAAGCQKKAATVISKTAKTYKIDGQADEWSEQFLTDKAFPDWTYQVDYNDQYLFVCTRTVSKTMQMMIIQQGAGVWLDTTSKRQDKMGISYPLALSQAQVEQLAKIGNDEKGLEKAYTESCKEFDMIGFAPEPLRATNTSSKHCKAALGYDELGELVCEYQIPWKFVYQNRTLRGDEQFNLHLRVNELQSTEEDMQNQNPNSVINNPNQMGGSMGNPMNPMGQNPNQMGGNPLNPNSGARQQLALIQARKPQMPSIWVKIKLN